MCTEPARPSVDKIVYNGDNFRSCMDHRLWLFRQGGRVSVAYQVRASSSLYLFRWVLKM